MDKFEIKWTAPEFEYRDKDVSWYWISIIIAVLLLGFAVWQKNFPFGFFVVIAEILLIIWGNREPNKAEFAVNEKGFGINGKKFYKYQEIAHFSLSDEMHPGHHELIFSFRHHLRPTLKVILPKENAEKVENALQIMVPQMEYEPSLVDALERFLGF